MPRPKESPRLGLAVKPGIDQLFMLGDDWAHDGGRNRDQEGGYYFFRFFRKACGRY